MSKKKETNQIEFLVEEDPDGGYLARAKSESIFTQADNRDDLREKALDAVRCHFADTAQATKKVRIKYGYNT